MKKTVTIVLLCAMLLSCLAGCGIQRGALEAKLYGNQASYETLGADESTVGITDALQANVDKAKAGTFAEAEVSVWDKTTVTSNWYDPNVSVTEYTINSAADLIAFRTAMGSYDFKGCTIKLGKNIDLNGATLEGLDARFKGSFDGQNHIVYNFDMTLGEATGFFGDVYATTISNFGLVDLTCTLTGAKRMGAVAAILNSSATAANIYSNAEIVTTSTSEIKQIGGVFGAATSGSTKTVSNCEFAGSITLGELECSYVGGIIGYWNKGTLVMENTVDSGAINAPKSSAVGGLVGFDEAVGAGTYDNCVNNATIVGATYVGGLLGSVLAENASNGNQTFTNCTNNGSVTGEKYVGGFAGRIALYGAELDVVDNRVVVTGCDSKGDVTANDCAGGFLGSVHAVSVTMTDCEFSGDLSVTFNGDEDGQLAGGLIGRLFQALDMPATAVLFADLSDCQVNGKLTFVDSTEKTFAAGVYVGGTENADVPVTYSKLSTGNNFAIQEGVQPQLMGNGSTVVGYQTTPVSDGKYNLRYVATANDVATDAALGFTVSIYVKNGDAKELKKTETVYTKTAYKTIVGGGESYAASDYLADYLFTLVITGVDAAYTPTNGSLEVLITPVVTVGEDTVASYTAQDGEIVISVG